MPWHPQQGSRSKRQDGVENRTVCRRSIFFSWPSLGSLHTCIDMSAALIQSFHIIMQPSTSMLCRPTII
jgi:hypothetical protein